MLPVRSKILVDCATCLFSKLFIAGIGMMVAQTIPPPTMTSTATVATMRLTSSHCGMLRKIIFIRLKRRLGAAICSGHSTPLEATNAKATVVFSSSESKIPKPLTGWILFSLSCYAGRACPAEALAKADAGQMCYSNGYRIIFVIEMYLLFYLHERVEHPRDRFLIRAAAACRRTFNFTRCVFKNLN